MATINLLPWRDARRERLKQEFFANLGASIIGAGLLVALIYFLLNTSISGQQARNAYIQQHIDQLNEDVSEIAQLKQQRAQLIERMEIIQGLQGNRPVIVRIFDQFVRTLPDGLYYTHLQRKTQQIQIDGTAESNNRVSSLMRRLDKSDWFANPNLTTVVANPAFGEQANNFSLTVSLATPGKVAEEAE